MARGGGRGDGGVRARASGSDRAPGGGDRALGGGDDRGQGSGCGERASAGGVHLSQGGGGGDRAASGGDRAAGGGVDRGQGGGDRATGGSADRSQGSSGGNRAPSGGIYRGRGGVEDEGRGGGHDGGRGRDEEGRGDEGRDRESRGGGRGRGGGGGLGSVRWTDLDGGERWTRDWEAFTNAQQDHPFHFKSTRVTDSRWSARIAGRDGGQKGKAWVVAEGGDHLDEDGWKNTDFVHGTRSNRSMMTASDGRGYGKTISIESETNDQWMEHVQGGPSTIEGEGHDRRTECVTTRGMTRRTRIFGDSSWQSGDENNSTPDNRTEDGHDEEAQVVNVCASVAQNIKKRGRGNSTMAFFACKNGHRYELQWNKLGQVIGLNERKFRSACAYYAHCHWLWPLDKKWKEMPKSALVNTWKLLEKDFILDGHPNALSFVSDVIHHRLIDWKNKVKRIWENNHREPDVMKAEVTKNPRINMIQFLNLVKEWEMPESKAKALTNKVNRKAKTLNHKSGSHSIAKIREKFEKENNKEPSDLDLMKTMYPNTEEAKKMESNVQKIRSQELEAPLEEVEKEAYVMAAKPVREDYVRFRGIGHDMSYRQSEHERLQELLQKSTRDQENIKELKEDVASLKALVERFGERMEQRDLIIQQQATLLQQLGHYVGFPYPHSYRHNVHDSSGVSGSVGETNDNSHDSGNNRGHIASGAMQSRRAIDADYMITSSSRCPPPLVGGHPTFTHHGYPQMYPLPPFSCPPQVQFSNHPQGSHVDTPPNHPKSRSNP